MKTYVIYHKSCYDGFGAAFAAWLYFRGEEGADVKYVSAHYGDPIPDVEKGSKVYMLDVSWSRQDLDNFVEHREVDLTILDHHKTAEEALKDFPGAVFDMNKSGAVLAYEHFFPKNAGVPALFLYLQDSDLWKFELPESKEHRTAMRLYPFKFEAWYSLFMDMQLRGMEADIFKQGKVALQLTEMTAGQSARHARTALAYKTAAGEAKLHIYTGLKHNLVVPIDATDVYLFPVTNAAAFVSEVGHQMLELYPGYDIAGYYFDRADGKRQWGLRSRPGVDCSKLAQLFGGGGHAQAAGFTTEP